MYFVERRRFPRFKVRYFRSVYFREKTRYASTIDISEVGVGILCNHKVFAGDHLNIKIDCHYPNFEKSEIHLKTRVIAVQESKEANAFKAGLEILEISQDDISNFRKLIKELSKV